MFFSSLSTVTVITKGTPLSAVQAICAVFDLMNSLYSLHLLGPRVELMEAFCDDPPKALTNLRKEN
jgi:hypothetical protein